MGRCVHAVAGNGNFAWIGGAAQCSLWRNNTVSDNLGPLGRRVHGTKDFVVGLRTG